MNPFRLNARIGGDRHRARRTSITFKPKERSVDMKRILAVVLFTVTLTVWSSARAVEPVDFEVDTTRNLLNLCAAPPSDPLYREALHFCHGYLVGAYDYYKASGLGSGDKKLFCLPDPPPSRQEAIAMFVEWLKVHPQYWGEEAVDTEFRFLMEKWPCKK